MISPAMFPLRRARLELDRTLRARPFVARAVQGRLAPPEYRALIAHALDLLSRIEPDPLLIEAARHDLEHLEPEHPLTSEVIVARLYARAIGRSARRTRVAGQVVSALLGTSWTEDAHDALELRYTPATQFLEAVGRTGRAALGRLSSELPAIPELHALTELTRGAVLGLVAHLEEAWPAPRWDLSLDLEGAKKP